MAKFTYTVRKDGRLVKKVTIKGKPIYLYSNDEKDLKKQYIDLLSKYNNNEYSKPSNYSVKDYAEIWYSNYVEPTMLDEQTKKMYSNVIRLYIIPNLGTIKLSKLSELDVTQMINTMTQQGITRRRELALQTIRQILDKAISNDLLSKNVAKSVKLVKHTPIEKKPLSQETIDNILSMDNSIDSSVFLMKFILTTGLRAEEVSPLTRNDILSNKMLQVNKVVDLESKDLKIDNYTKNKDTRQVPLIDSIYQYAINLNGILFPNKFGELKSRSSFRRDLERFLNIYNTTFNTNEYFTLHQLRHTYACILHKAGVPLKEAQSFTGHKDLKVLLQIYTHLDENDIQNASSILNNYLS